MAASPQAVVKELLQVAQKVGNQEPVPIKCQRKNMSVLIRRVKLLLPVLEEVRDIKLLLPPSAVAAFQELHSIMLKALHIIDRFKSSSQLWMLSEYHEFSRNLLDICHEMSIPLSSIPLNLMELPIELKEQVELLKVQSKRTNLSVDGSELGLHEELMNMLQEFEHRKTPSTDRIESLFKALCLESTKDCQRELQQLRKQQAEVRKRNPQIDRLVNFICYSSCVLYGMVPEEAAGATQEYEAEEDKHTVTNFSVPDEFRCPISLEMMRDPVIIATGQTYDRGSIQRWVEAGNMTCPKTGQRLIHMTLIPNFALRSLIAQWCEKNSIPYRVSENEPRVDHIASSQAALEATKMTASFLVGKLAMGTPEIQKQAAYELRLLAKSGMENRKCIADAGAIPFLISLLLSHDATAQENAITALLNLSILEANKVLIMHAGALDPIVSVLCTGLTSEARENAAATIFSLSTVDHNKVFIGNKGKAIPALVELLRTGSQTGKKDAVSALFNLSLLSANKAKAIEAGVVSILVEIIENEMSSDLVENSLALLGLLAAYEPGANVILETPAMQNLVRVLGSGSLREKENAAAVLLALCRSRNHVVMQSLMSVPGSISTLHSLLATGSSRGRRKATSLMKMLHNWDASAASQ